MNRLMEIALKTARRICMVRHKLDETTLCDAQTASDAISRLLSGDKPCMIARFGSTEMNAIQNYLAIKNNTSLFSYLSGKSSQWWWNKKGLYELKNNAGFFPNGITDVERFCELMIRDAGQIDFLGSWLQNEKLLCPQLQNTEMTPLRYLEPFWAAHPWIKALEGRNVLVIHPFAELIETQYKNKRTVLFDNPDILPEFNLLTVKAVQSLGGEFSRFRTWFEALEWMEDGIDNKDYDVALIGCGAYGLPLAAHIKSQGKKAVHLGGVLQLLFGIKGSRWEDPMYGVREWGIPEGFYPSLMNDHWIKAGAEFRPKNADDVEKACYW